VTIEQTKSIVTKYTVSRVPFQSLMDLNSICTKHFEHVAQKSTRLRFSFF